MKSKYKHIFEPLTIKHMTLNNRIVMTPMGTNYGEQNGEMSFLHINYYEQRAKGGTGLLIVENASVDSPQGSNGSIQYQIDANYLPDGWRSYMAKAVKERYGKPCMTMGNIRSPQVAEDILARGDADLIGMGRGLIADPEWVNKVEFGDECGIRKCISCNIGCAGNRIGINRPIRCTVNPSVNGGEDYKKKKDIKTV